MKASELKFVLKLLGNPPSYRMALTEMKTPPKAGDREKLCRELGDRELVAYSTEIQRFRIEPPGKALLRLKAVELPVTEAELRILQACRQGSCTIAGLKSLGDELQPTLRGLCDRGLIKATSEKIREVWLTDRGKLYLRDDCTPTGTATISLNLLNNYLRFLRKPLELIATPTLLGAPLQPAPPPTLGSLSDEDLLALITSLDHELGTENYLPIFHLRDKLRYSLSRDQLDEALYRLQRHDRIELSALQEAIAYTPEQIEAGIPQAIGGCLFFISRL
jgi:hypothetical protein